MSAESKQVRFTQLVKAAGNPHPATLWVADPNEDPEFKKAIAENRILTIHHVNVGGKKESGEIGFQSGGASGYLIFPKALPMTVGTRVIGLKFDMLAEAPVKDPVKIKPAKPKPKAEPVKVIKFPAPEKEEEKEEKESDEEVEVEDVEEVQEEKPAPKKAEAKKSEPKAKPLVRFKITVEYTATATREIEVEAKNAAEAIQFALAEAEKQAPKPDWQLDAQNVKRCD